MTGQTHRLPEGGRIERSRRIRFRFDGREYEGLAGDTLASALLANGVMLVGRSFKYHRPRGVFSAGAEEPNALVQLGTGAASQPNLRATQVDLHEGLVAASVNCWPSPSFDLGAVNSRLAGLLPAGFYYKTFMRPRSLWHSYERAIRRAAGLGRAPDGPDPDRYDRMHAHCDVLVAGGGPAGLAAALAAGRTGARVILADEQNEFGGTLLSTGDTIDGIPGTDWMAAALAELRSMPEVRLLPRSTVAGYYDHNYLTVLERVTDHLGSRVPHDRPRQRLWKVRARQVVLATGAIERPLVFPDNDRPGVMLAASARCYVRRYAVAPGRCVVVFTNNDSAYEAALDIAAAGIMVAAVVDLRPGPGGGLAEAARARGIDVLRGHAVAAVHGVRRVRAVEVRALDHAGTALVGPGRRIDCDLVAVSGGWNPTVHLFSQSRGRLRFDSALGAFLPGRPAQNTFSAGAANGGFDLATCLVQGHEAGAAAAAAAGFPADAVRPPSARPMTAEPIRLVWLVPSVPSTRGGKRFVDLQDDVTAADIALAVREGYESVEHLKRYTTLGMGTDQGKTANVNGLGILAGLLGTDVADLGVTTFRPPYTPVTFGAIAGRDIGDLADPLRRTPIQDWHVAAGAEFEDVGYWRRPRYYPRPGESMSDAVRRECLAVRQAVGVLDASTLGKIEVQGPDAVTFLNRIYTNSWDRLGIGRCRYGLMLGEDGMVKDDGVTTRLAEHRYLVSTTTGNAAAVMAWLEEWLQTEWPELRVYLTSVTEQWATASIAGPLARAVMARLTDDIDLSAEAFPFMAMRTGTVAGVPGRVFRISFTGELSYEISVPASQGASLWKAVMAEGQAFGITPFGTEAMHVLRAEKGYIMVGQETDGTVTPLDLGMGALVSRSKDFLGRRSLARPEMRRADRKQLVGLLPEDPQEVLPEGAQIVATVRDRPPMPMVGHVTSSYFSPTLGRSFALALVAGGRARHGERVHLPLDHRAAAAVIGPPVFHDPDGVRLRG